MVPMRTDLAHRANYGGRRTQKVEYIVIHYTANDGDSDTSNANYFKKALNPVSSAHYFVDDDSITCSVPEDFVAYHCGAQVYYHPKCRNANSIGVELCDAKRDGAVMATDRTLHNAAHLVSMLMKKYGVPIGNVIMHYDVTHKACPAYWVKDRSGFERFKKMVQEADEMVEKSYMIVDGKRVEVERILKDGTNFIKIRDIAKALDLEVGFHGSIATLTRK